MGKLKIASAVNGKFKHDVSGSKLGTIDFGMLVPSHVFPLQMGDSINVSFGQVTQMDSLPLPTFSRLRMRHLAIWVPMRVIDHNYNSYRAYLNQQDSSLSGIADGPLYSAFSNADLCTCILQYDNTVAISRRLVVPGTSNDYDVAYDNVSGGGVNYYKFTDRGRYVMNILESLGYRLNWSSSDSSVLDLSVLWAFARFFYDFIYPSQWVQTQAFGKIFAESNTLNGVTDGLTYNVATRSIFDLFVVPFEKDFYTSAWLSSNSPNGQINLPSFTGKNAVSSVNGQLTVSQTNQSTALQQVQASNVTTISGYGLRLLSAVSDIVTRHNLAGSRFFERLKSRYGFVTRQVRSEYSQLVKTWMDEVDIKSVIATGESQISVGQNTNTTLLGDKGGYGGSFATGHDIKFDADEDGYLIFAYMLVPSIGYVQGRKPWTRGKLQPSDWYTPELDGVGVQPIRNDMLFAEFDNPSDYSNGQAYGGKPDGVFGFQFSYSDLKIGHDFLTGDFNRRTINKSGWMNAYHTFRLLPLPAQSVTPGESNPKPLVLDSNFLLQYIYGQFNRIFNVDSGNNFVVGQDHFVTFFRFNAERTDNMKSVSESVPLFDKSGDKVKVEVNGESLG